MTPAPFFSIIIPTYNRPQQLANCLQSLAALDYPRDRFEVIVVDDGGAQALDDIVSAHNSPAHDGDSPQTDALAIQLIRQENGGPGSARNRGVEAAQGPYLAFTDDDCMPHLDWLSQAAARLQANPEALIGGHVLNALTDNLYSSASQQLIDYLYSYYHGQDRGISFFTSNNMALSKQNYLQIGGFDAKLRIASEDRELCDRWLQQGNPLIYAPEMQISHAHDLTLRSFWKQHFSYGRGAYHFHGIRAQRAAQAIKVEPLAFYINLLLYPLRQGKTAFQWGLSGLFFLSQFAMTMGFFSEKLRATQPGHPTPG